MDQYVSYRKFAELIGVSDTAVRKAVKAGYIQKGVVGLDTIRPKINVPVACAEWGKELVNADAPKKAAPVKKRKPAIKKTVSDLPEPKKIAVPYDDDEDDDGDTFMGSDLGDPVEVSDGMSMTDAKRMEAILKAKKLKLQVEHLEGTLVEKNAVEKKLFEKGQQVRSSLLSIPDRIAANLLACKSVTEAVNMLTDEMIAALESLATDENEIKINL